MITKSVEIADGVRINYIETNKFKTNYFSFRFIGKRCKELATLNTLITRVLTHGSTRYPSQAEIEKRLKYLYMGDVWKTSYANGKYHIFGIGADMLNDRFATDLSISDEMLDLVCDIIFNPLLENGAFSAEYTESEKQELIDIINAEINNKGKYAINKCTDLMFKDEIFSVGARGDVKDVERVTPKQLYEAYKKALSEYKIEIYFIGSLDIDRAIARIEPYFDGIKRSVEKIDDISIVKKAEKVNEYTEIQDVKQGKLCMGFRTGHAYDDGYKSIALVFNEVYGGSPNSKLFVNVREKKSLCYSCYSKMSVMSGSMMVSAGIEASNKQVAIDAILEQLENMKKTEITDEELENAKKSIKNALLGVYDSASSIQTRILNSELFNDTLSLDEELADLNAVTKEQLAEFAQGITLDTIYFLKGEDANG